MLLTEATVREHFDAIQRGDYEKVAALLHDDFVQDWPQSGERVRGRDACTRIYANYPGGGPTVALKRVVGSGDAWVTEADADYGGKVVQMVSILEFRDDLLIHETDYFADPFEAPEWRREWVERLE
jgi:ketosteroid isomerase-like protein